MKEKIVLDTDYTDFYLKEHIAGHLKTKGYAIGALGGFNKNSVEYPSIPHQKRVDMTHKFHIDNQGNPEGVPSC